MTGQIFKKSFDSHKSLYWKFLEVAIFEFKIKIFHWKNSESDVAAKNLK